MQNVLLVTSLEASDNRELARLTMPGWVADGLHAMESSRQEKIYIWVIVLGGFHEDMHRVVPCTGSLLLMSQE
jgi:hypothetical protein